MVIATSFSVQVGLKWKSLSRRVNDLVMSKDLATHHLLFVIYSADDKMYLP